MREVKFRRREGSDFCDGTAPRFDVEFGRNKRRSQRTAAKPNTGNIAAEHGIVPVINVMMAGVTRCCDRANFEWGDADKFVVLQNADAFWSDPGKFSPQLFHLVAVKTSRRGNQLSRIDEMGRAARMHVDRRAQFREPPGRAGVIEMDMTEKDAPNVARIEPKFAELVRDIVEGRFRPGIEKRQPIVRFERGRCDDAGPAEMLRIENVNHSSPRGVKLGRGFFGAVPRAVRGSYLSMVSQCFWRTA